MKQNKGIYKMSEKSRPFLGTPTNDVDKAFPNIKKLDISIDRDPWGYYCSNKGQKIVHFTKSSLQRYVSCPNQRCQQGGLDLQSIISYRDSDEFTISCNGHEGSPKGRRKGDPCDNAFKITLKIERE